MARLEALFRDATSDLIAVVGASRAKRTSELTSQTNLALIEINQIAEPSNLGNKKPNPQFIFVSTLRLYDRIITFVTLHLKHIYDFEK